MTTSGGIFVAEKRSRRGHSERASDQPCWRNVADRVRFIEGAGVERWKSGYLSLGDSRDAHASAACGGGFLVASGVYTVRADQVRRGAKIFATIICPCEQTRLGNSLKPDVRADENRDRTTRQTPLFTPLSRSTRWVQTRK